MIFDYIFKFAWPGYYSEKFIEPDTKKDLPIEKFFKHINGSNALVVIIPGWKNSPSVDKFFEWRIMKSKQSCLRYCFHPDLLSANPEYTVKEFLNIKEKIKKDILELKMKFGYAKIKLVASSLGAVSAMLVANNNKDIDQLFLLVPGSCIDYPLWYGIRTKKLKKIYEKKGINIEKLHNLWKEIAPINNADSLEDKKICTYISKSDKAIPYKYGKELSQYLINRYKKAEEKENILWGHYLSIVKFYLFERLN